MEKQKKDPKGKTMTKRIPHLDELALRLEVKASEEPDELCIFGMSGRAYPLIEILRAHTELTITCFLHTVNTASRIEALAGSQPEPEAEATTEEDDES